MKKLVTKLTLSLSMLILLNSCTKEQKKIDAQTPYPNHIKSASRTKMTPGGEHNLILSNYIDDYGISTGPLTASESQELYTSFLGIAASLGMVDSASMPSALKEHSISEIVNSGYYSTDSLFQGYNEFFNATIPEFENKKIKYTWAAINNTNYTGDDFLNFANNQIDSLIADSSLSDADIEDVQYYQSVLDSSYVFWTHHYSSSSAQQRKISLSDGIKIIATADAYAASYGYHKAMDLGYWWCADGYAVYYSAKVSNDTSIWLDNMNK